MNYIVILIPLLLLVALGAIWAGLRMYFRNMEKPFVGKDLGVDDLSNLKGRLTEEEYRRLQQAIVRRVTEEREDKGSVKKELNLFDLEAELRAKASKQENQRKSDSGVQSDLGDSIQ